MKKFYVLIIVSITVCKVLFAQAPQIQWQKSYGGTQSDYTAPVRQTTDGGFVLVGGTSSNDGDVSGNNGNNDIWVLKINSTGTIQWQKCLGGSDYEDVAYPNPNANSIRQTTDGGYIIAGMTYSNDSDVSGNHGDADMWVVKLDSAANIQWQKCLGGTFDDYGTAVQQTNDGGYIVAGYTGSNDSDVTGNHGLYDYWVVKLSSAGNIQWKKCYGGSDEDYAYAIQQTADSGYVVAGYTYSNDGNVSGNHGCSFGCLPDYWVVKLNSAGNLQWQKCLGGSDDDRANDVYQTSDKGYIITGYTSSNDGDLTGNTFTGAWVVKLDSSGSLKWQKCYGGPSAGTGGSSVEPTNDGGYIMACISQGNGGDVTGHHDTLTFNADYWLVKINSLGTLQWQKCLGGYADDYAVSLHQTTDGGFIVSGYSFSNNGDVTGNHGSGDSWVVKLSISTGTDKENNFSDLIIYPNPAKDEFTVYGLEFTVGGTIEVYNVFGEKVYSAQVEGGNKKQETINCQQFSPGIYFVKVANEKMNWVGKFVKE